MVIRNFLFHRVSDEPDLLWPPMKPSLFRSIIAHLTRLYHVVPLENCLADPGAFQSKKKLVTVLFDDGYKDNIEMAVPILKQFNCPASFYVVTDSINKNIPTWTYIIDHLFQQTRKKELQLGFDFVPEQLKKVTLGIDSKHNVSAKTVKPWLKKLSNSQRVAVVESIQQQCDDVIPAAGNMMDWQDIRQLNSDGFIIGSHSHTHPMLASMENETEIAQELKLSSDTISKEIGKHPNTISYPIGSYDERVTRISKEQGYKYGLAVEQRFYNTGKDDEMAIPRVELYQEPWWKVQSRITGIYSSVKKIWR